MQPAVPRYGYLVRRGLAHGLRSRRRRNYGRAVAGGVGAYQRRKHVLEALKKKADELKVNLPTFSDVNRIDKGSRVIFPALFIVFNVVYWCFFILQ